MSIARRWARRAALSALAGGGITAAGLAGQIAPALGGEGSGGAKRASTPGAEASSTSTSTITSSVSSTSSSTSGSSSTSTTQTSSSTGVSTQSASSSSSTSSTQTGAAPRSGGQATPSVLGEQEQEGSSAGGSAEQRHTKAGKHTGSKGKEGKGGKEEGKGGEEGKEGKEGKGGSKEGKTGGKEGKAQGEGNVAPAPQTVASQAEALASLLGSPAVSVQALDYYRIPMFLLPIYQAAAVQYGVPWQVLAAINEVETNYGSDLSISTAGAEGWMQFMPATWLQYGVDVQDTGYADPYNPVDAIFAAARYLRAAGAAHDLKGAILAYNHSEEYVESVMLRAKLIAHYPAAVIDTLTGLAEGSLPVAHGLATAEALLGTGSVSPSIDSVRPGHRSSTKGSSAGAKSTSSAAKAGTALTPGSSLAPTPQQSAAAASGGSTPKQQRFADLVSPSDSPVIAVQDGKIVGLGHSRKLGDYVILRDVYGDVFTYAGLGSIASTYSPPKLSGSGQIAGIVAAGAESKHESAPSTPATSGSQSPLTLHVKTKSQAAESGSVEPTGEAGEGAGKVRMYAHPGSAYAHAAVARARAAGTLYGQHKPLKVGSVVSQGTVLGKTSPGTGLAQGHLRFAISPAGDSGTVQVQPVLESWRQLESALHPQGAKRDSGLIGATAGDAFLLSRAELRRAVLSDPGIGLNACTKSDIASGAVDTQVLATLVFLSRSGLKPTLGAMPCASIVKGGISLPGQSRTLPPLHSFQIVKVNGVEIAGHQGPGSIADLTIRTLLTLQGKFAPNAITSLMHYPGSLATHANRGDWRTIRIAFTAPTSEGGSSTAAKGAAKAKTASTLTSSALLVGGGLGSSQWSSLIGRIGTIAQPHISRKRSSASIPDGGQTHGH